MGYTAVRMLFTRHGAWCRGGVGATQFALMACGAFCGAQSWNGAQQGVWPQIEADGGLVELGHMKACGQLPPYHIYHQGLADETERCPRDGTRHGHRASRGMLQPPLGLNPMTKWSIQYWKYGNILLWKRKENTFREQLRKTEHDSGMNAIEKGMGYFRLGFPAAQELG